MKSRKYIGLLGFLPIIMGIIIAFSALSRDELILTILGVVFVFIAMIGVLIGLSLLIFGDI